MRSPDTMMKYDDNRFYVTEDDDGYIGGFGLVPVETSNKSRSHRRCDRPLGAAQLGAHITKKGGHIHLKI